MLLAALLATALGGAFVAFESAGGFRNPLAEASTSGASATPSSDKSTPKAGSSSTTATQRPGNDAKTNTIATSLTKTRGIGDPTQLDSLLPSGITHIEGMGGKGYARQVKSGGAWFPVFNLAKAKKRDGSAVDPTTDDLNDADALDPGSVELSTIALAITTPNPPPGLVAQPFHFTLAAIGGTPPYQWAMQLGAGTSDFSLNPSTGEFSGSSDKPLATTLQAIVTDATGASDAVAYSLVIAPAQPLAITHEALPIAIVGDAYTAKLNATGGVPPYAWSIAGLDAAWFVDAATGILTATPSEAGEQAVQITVEDAQHTSAQLTLPLKTSAGLEISTESPLLPAAPGSDYVLLFQATGGSGDYTWSLASGGLSAGWTLSREGRLGGIASARESLQRFTVQVRDSDGLVYRKAFDLATRKALIAVPSRDRVGLAWQPAEIARIAAAPLAGVIIERRGPDGLAEVYRGTGSNVVDHGAQTGASYDYTLTAHTADGRAVPIASTHVKVLPITRQRAVSGLRGDPFADRVSLFSPLSPTAYGMAAIPFNVIGPPDGRSTYQPASATNQVASLNAAPGAGGSIVLEFTDNIIELGAGLDFTVFENVFFEGGDSTKRFMEPAIVEVALFEGQWFRFPSHINPPITGTADLTRPAYYAQGFAGISATTGETPTDPARSGGDSFDANALGIPGLTWIRFIRLQSTGDKALTDATGQLIEHRRDYGATSGGGSSGFDLDAVSAVNY